MDIAGLRIDANSGIPEDTIALIGPEAFEGLCVKLGNTRVGHVAGANVKDGKLMLQMCVDTDIRFFDDHDYQSFGPNKVIKETPVTVCMNCGKLERPFN